MSEKKGFFASLFGSKKGGCCNMEITENPNKKGSCCDMQIIEENDEVKFDSNEDILIQILGNQYKNCVTLERNVKLALSQMGRDDAVTYITDNEKMAAYGVISEPALVFNGKVVSSGKVLNIEEIKKIIQENL